MLIIYIFFAKTGVPGGCKNVRFVAQIRSVRKQGVQSDKM